MFILTPYEIFWFFLIYSFIGWCVEVIYHAVVAGRIINRGFLCGPVCPVYGFGMLAICTMTSVYDTESMGHAGVLVVFLGGMLLASSIELLAGWLLLKLFHARWWDYRNEPFNLGGFICLRFSLIWGTGTVLMVRVIHPIVADLTVRLIPPRIGWWILAFCYAGWLADTIVTVLSVMGLNKKLQELEELRLSMRVVSDSMSQALGERSLRDKQRLDESRVQAALARAELRDARQERRRKAEEKAAALRSEILAHRHFGTGRILRGVPELVHVDYEDTLQELQQFLSGAPLSEASFDASLDDTAKKEGRH